MIHTAILDAFSFLNFLQSFKMWAILKGFIKFVTISLLFYVVCFVFSCRNVRSYLPDQGWNLYLLHCKAKS